MNNEVKRVPAEDGTLTDEEILALQPDAEEAKKEYREFKDEQVKTILATKEVLFARRNRIFNLEVDFGDQVVIFKVRRMSEKERVQYNKMNNTRFSGDWNSVTAEQMDEIMEQSYKIMADLIVEPKLNVDEWKEIADSALLNYLSTKVSLLSTEVNDAVLIEEFKKKSMKSQNSK